METKTENTIFIMGALKRSSVATSQKVKELFHVSA
jgi:hypothetical protein